MKTKLCRLNSWVLSNVLFRIGLWRYTDALAKRLDRLQGYMLAGCMNTSRRHDEADEDFYRRRSIAAGKLCTQFGLWSKKFALYVEAWDKHCLRASTREFFGSISTYMVQGFFEARRTSFSSGRTSRTNTRSYHGKVGLRYHDSVFNARQSLISSGTPPDRSQVLDVIFEASDSEVKLTVHDHDVLSLANQNFELIV